MFLSVGVCVSVCACVCLCVCVRVCVCGGTLSALSNQPRFIMFLCVLLNLFVPELAPPVIRVRGAAPMELG